MNKYAVVDQTGKARKYVIDETEAGAIAKAQSLWGMKNWFAGCTIVLDQIDFDYPNMAKPNANKKKKKSWVDDDDDVDWKSRLFDN